MTVMAMMMMMMMTNINTSIHSSIHTCPKHRRTLATSIVTRIADMLARPQLSAHAGLSRCVYTLCETVFATHCKSTTW